jgi:hypothetical protein
MHMSVTFHSDDYPSMINASVKGELNYHGLGIPQINDEGKLGLTVQRYPGEARCELNQK